MAHPAVGLIPCRLQLPANGIGDALPAALCLAQGFLTLGQRLAGGVFQEPLQLRHAPCPGLGQVNLIRGQRREHHHFPPGPGYGHIQPPPASIPIQGAEVHIYLSCLVRAVAHGEENHIPLVALDVFQVLDEHRLLRTIGPLFQLRIREAGFVQKIINEILLGNVEGHNAYAAAPVSGIVTTALQFRHHSLGLGPVLPGLAPGEHAVHMNEVHLRGPVIYRWEGVELIIVEFRVAEGDEALVPGSVVPQQMGFGHIEGQAIVQNAFQILQLQIVLIHPVCGKERSRGHLLGVAHNDGIFPPGQGPYGLAGRKLGRLVKHHQVKGLPVGIQILSGGNGAHKHTGAEPGQQLWKLLEKSADADTPAAAADGPLQNT